MKEDLIGIPHKSFHFCKIKYSLLKQIDKLVASSFFGPYLVAFFIAEFVLLMQFLWKYIDNILGKGISFFDIMELLGYLSVTLIPMAIPLTILISSVLVFGNLAERYELSSMKSAGISLFRIMRAGFVIAILTCLFSILSSNYLVPKANFGFHSRFDAIKRAKPSMTIEEGVFNKDFRGYVIKVNKKDPDGRGISDVLIWDHSDSDKSLENLITAEKGEMYVTEDGNNFVMNLFDGIQYKELRDKSPKVKGKIKRRKYPFMRVKFAKLTKVFSMEGFSFSESSANIRKNKFDLLNTFQMMGAIDSLDASILKKLESVENHDFKGNEAKKKNIKKSKIVDSKRKEKPLPKTKKGVNTLKNKNKKASKKSRNPETEYEQKRDLELTKLKGFTETFDSTSLRKLLIKTYPVIIGQRDKLTSVRKRINALNKEKRMFRFKLNQQYSVALICIIFLFIGGPLGSIVKKGGYGYPLLYAIIFYMIFMMSFIAGQKLNRSASVDPFVAAWLPCMILIPISVFLTYKAIKDQQLFDLSALKSIFSKNK